MEKPGLNRDWSEVFQQTRFNSSSRILLNPRHEGFTQTQKSANFCTGSSYRGGYNALGFAGFGIYIYPHGAVYKGQFKNGQFHGEGRIEFPKGQIIEGSWLKGKLIKYTYKYADGLEYTKCFNYLSLPDRSYQVEIKAKRFQPPGEEYITNEPREIEKGWYDTGDGFYDPSKHYVKKCGRILRIVTKEEECIIKQLFMCNADKNVGFIPHLYEYWTTGSSKEERHIENDMDLWDRQESRPRLNSDYVPTPNYVGTRSEVTLYTYIDGAFFL